jgi:hypothetical protein
MFISFRERRKNRISGRLLAYKIKKRSSTPGAVNRIRDNEEVKNVPPY